MAPVTLRMRDVGEALLSSPSEPSYYRAGGGMAKYLRAQPLPGILDMDYL